MVMPATRKVVLFGVLAAVTSVIGQASAASPATTAVRCSWHTYLKNGQISDRGTIVGSVSCGDRFGKGSYNGRYRNKVNPYPFIGSETGSSRLTFMAGSVRGTYKVGPTAISGTAPYRGMFHITGGTGKFRHISGTLRLTCTHSIPPITDCTVAGPATGV
jgi:hypothetical protein